MAAEGPEDRRRERDAAGLGRGAVDLLAAPRLRTWLLVVATIVAVEAAGYMLLEGWSAGDALHDHHHGHDGRVPRGR